MLKKWMLGMILLSTSLFTQATLINSDVTSVDMTGIEITALFSDGSTDKQIWSAFSSTLGGVSTSAWSLMLDGNTFGDFDGSTNTFYGLWTLENASIANSIVGLTVNAGIADILFDIGSDPVASTPGSEAGREFASNDVSAVASFSDVYSSPDLFGTMDITGFNLAVGQQLTFLTDTDMIAGLEPVLVPEPATMFTFALGLMALISVRKKSSGK